MVNYYGSNLSAEPDQWQQMSSLIDTTENWGTILLVDDTPDNLRLLSLALAQQGCEVCTATSGAIALACMEEIQPDLVLLDIMMPEMDGYEVCRRLKANPATQKIPVMFISAIHDVLDKVKAFKVGGVDYITKPVQMEEALARIEHQLKLRQLQQRLETQNLQLQKEIQERQRAETRLQYLNADLERQVQIRTAQLQLAYHFEATLKRITDRVRDSLDESQILQTALQELVQATGVESCNAALYDLEHQTSTICYEHTDSLDSFRGRVLEMNNFSEGYYQLLQGVSFQFCSWVSNSLPDYAAMLACPILDDQGVLGDLWLVSQSQHVFSEQDVRLVQQVANQCAIALRQARLYQAVQEQVKELEKLNQLKDDFLSTVSHELRTPMSSIKLATQMLEISLMQPQPPEKQGEALRYLKILHEECQREIDLINDLLDLSRLDAGTEPLILTTVALQNWIPHLAESFSVRAASRQQCLQFDLAPDIPALTTDFSYLGRILTELLNNAYKYTPAGGTIIVSAATVDTPKLDDPLYFQISVRNSSSEIPTQELSKIFDKFYRIPNNDPWKYGGTGLGLALVKKRMEQLQGSISVASEPGWVTFVLTLPQQEFS